MSTWRKTLGDLRTIGRLLARQTLPPPEYEGAVATWRRVLNHYRVTWEWYRIAPVLKSYPSRLCIESTGACNLRCPYCFTGAGDDGRPRQMLSLHFYRRLLAELGPRLWQVEFHNWGEPMLNPHLATMVSAATALGLSTSLCTNFSLPFDSAKAEALVSADAKDRFWDYVHVYDDGNKTIAKSVLRFLMSHRLLEANFRSEAPK